MIPMNAKTFAKKFDWVNWYKKCMIVFVRNVAQPSTF